MPKIVIAQDELTDDSVEQLLAEHRAEMLKHSPPENVHALDSKALRAECLTFWSARINGQHAGCGALKELDSSHGEIKSMKTRESFIRLGVAAALLEEILAEAVRRGYSRVSLETGTMDVFIPARTLYEKAGFVECVPFSNYFEDTHSVCMTKFL